MAEVDSEICALFGGRKVVWESFLDVGEYWLKEISYRFRHISACDRHKGENLLVSPPAIYSQVCTTRTENRSFFALKIDNFRVKQAALRESDLGIGRQPFWRYPMNGNCRSLKIGRASCREGGSIGVGGDGVSK